jgi:transportin-3
MFAAQTFRAKVGSSLALVWSQPSYQANPLSTSCHASLQVTYDLSELDSSSLLSLRSSLFDALRIFSVPGSRPILVQVCLSLADLAVQMMEWDQVVQGMIDQFGKDVGMVPALLEFLRVLPEEAGNPKIAMAVS